MDVSRSGFGNEYRAVMLGNMAKLGGRMLHVSGVKASRALAYVVGLCTKEAIKPY